MAKIDEMVASYPDKVSSLNVSISAVDEQLTDLQEQQTALNDVLDQVESEQDNLLINKRDANNWEWIWKGSNYGSTNVSDFRIGNEYPSTNLTYVNSTTFTLDDDATGTFSSSVETISDCGVDGIKYGVVSSSTYTASANTTEVVLDGGSSEALTSNLTGVGTLVYEYNGTGWDSDSDIEQRIDEFDFTYDHLTKPLGINGTYGINESITQRQNAKTLLVANRDKYEEAINKYDRFGDE